MQAAANGARAAQQPQHTVLYHDDTHNRPIARSGRLVYARPQDLPSFPSVGLDVKGSAASAAATLGWANRISSQPRRPATITASNSTIAIIPEDHKSNAALMAEDGNAKTALLAAQSAASNRASRSSSISENASATSRTPKLNHAHPRDTNPGALEHHRSLVAAKGAVARRQRAESAPIPRESYPDEANAAANALNAATRAHHPTLYPVPIEEAGAVPYTTMNKLMFTSRPPVKPEVDEQQRADVLHASAVAMAKRMYTQQQKMIDAKKTHADHTPPRSKLDVSSSVSDDQQPAHLTTLQDAAYKQAQARLASMQQKNAQNRDLEDYYGTKPLSRLFSVGGKLRKRSVSDGAVIEDQQRSRLIKKEMSLFSQRLSEVDEKKRQQDQDMLLAAAQRNVHEQLKGMDAKIATETGMAPPPTLTQWETKARAIAQSRILHNDKPQRGKVDIGAGIQIDQEDINAIAARRVQPILDEINAKAELEHARQLEVRLEAEKKKEKQEAEKARQREAHDVQKKLKQQEKQEHKERRAEEKQEARAKKEEEKAAHAEKKKLARAEKSKPSEHEQDVREQPEDEPDMITMNSSGQPVRIPRLSTQQTGARTSPEAVEEGPKSPKSPPGKVKNWLKSRFTRGPKSPTEDNAKGGAVQTGFIGGASLTGTRAGQSATSLDSRSASVREVAMAGRNSGFHQSRPEGDPEVVSPLSAESDDEYFRDEAADQLRTELTPPRPIRDTTRAQSQSPGRDSRFHEII
ncbi:hypothetical protein F4777DRAFT_162696 [Nemania sp. FL0916]|nr:hypothetical protein F4777DRAFT_162696 [Nemania sp. FL0916]